MEHLPRTSTKSTLDIDFGIDITSADILIDDGNFAHYLERQLQRHSAEAPSSILNQIHTTTIKTLLISWWFFQLLASQKTPRDLAKQDRLEQVVDTFTVSRQSESLVLNTSGLIAWLKASHAHRSRLAVKDGKVQSRNKQPGMSKQQMMTVLDDMSIQRQVLSSGQQLAIVLLFETLCHANEHTQFLSNDGAYEFCNSWGHVSIPAIEQQILPSLGCVNWVYMTKLRFSWTHLLYAGSLKYPAPLQDHSNCGETQCVTCRVDTVPYSLRHVEHCNGCNAFGPPVRLLESFVSNGKIPLVRLDSIFCQGDLLIETASSSTCYVVLSHVWSQLFGHDLGNFLPWCQLQRLQSWAFALDPKPTHMWLDILCVPRAHPTLRAAGIAQIKPVIEDADHVLVLDETLIRSSFDLRLWEETLVRICISQWMRRLWTLHEAVLAKNLSFQFTNGPFYLISLSASHVLDDEMLRYNLVGAVALASLQAPQKFRSEPDGATKLARLWNLLRWRSTSWPEQETICLFNMLHAGRNAAEPMSDIPIQSRMETLLSMYREFPADLIFMHGPRLATQGYGWSPVSWLTREQTFEQQQMLMLPLSNVGERTSAGLNVRYPGACLQVKLCEMIDSWSSYARIRFTDQYYNKKRIRLPDVPDDRIRRLSTRLAKRQIAIIYDQEFGHQDRPSSHGHTGVLVALSTASGDHGAGNEPIKLASTPCQFLCVVGLTNVEQGSQVWAEDRTSSQTSYLQLQVVNYVDYWCIG